MTINECGCDREVVVADDDDDDVDDDDDDDDDVRLLWRSRDTGP